MKSYTLKILGIISFLIGCVFVLNSFSEITGFAITESFGKGMSSILGLVFILGGIVLFLLERESKYNEIAGMVYELLGRRGSYGHHTENLGHIERQVSGGGISPKEVRKVINKEAEKGRLHTKKGISLNQNPKKLGEIIDKFGNRIHKNIRERFFQLKEKYFMEGVRGRGKS